MKICRLAWGRLIIRSLVLCDSGGGKAELYEKLARSNYVSHLQMSSGLCLMGKFLLVYFMSLLA